MRGLGAGLLFCVVVSALFCGVAFSGELRISVAVEDGGSLPGATVIVEGPLSTTSATDSSGRALFSNLPTGGYTVLVSLEGFETVRRRVYVSAEASRELDFVAKLATVKEEIAVDGSVAIVGDAASIDSTTEPGRDLESANCGVNGTGAVAFYTAVPDKPAPNCITGAMVRRGRSKISAWADTPAPTSSVKALPPRSEWAFSIAACRSCGAGIRTSGSMSRAPLPTAARPTEISKSAARGTRPSPPPTTRPVRWSFGDVKGTLGIRCLPSRLGPAFSGMECSGPRRTTST